MADLKKRMRPPIDVQHVSEASYAALAMTGNSVWTSRRRMTPANALLRRENDEQIVTILEEAEQPERFIRRHVILASTPTLSYPAADAASSRTAVH